MRLPIRAVHAPRALHRERLSRIYPAVVAAALSALLNAVLLGWAAPVRRRRAAAPSGMRRNSAHARP
ncbi:hypothetical protein V2S66_23655 [Streptomyces sp. V4-01]|uniref:Uncharacterized protein n=1 Tax=Actinacidiphila polyblastidii TaxID=3110430 RepID=A0ABU7PGJ9_9ACTN|nr:hypothetical protein [Streptomyces sp. V4-01]